MGEGDDDTRTGGADGMTERDRPAVDVEPIEVEAELPVTRQDLSRERFVELDQIDVVQAEAGLIQELSNRRDGSDAHDGGVDAGGGVADDARHRLDTERRGLVFAHAR